MNTTIRITLRMYDEHEEGWIVQSHTAEVVGEQMSGKVAVLALPFEGLGGRKVTGRVILPVNSRNVTSGELTRALGLYVSGEGVTVHPDDMPKLRSAVRGLMGWSF